MTQQAPILPVTDDGAALRNAAAGFRELPAMPGTVTAVLEQLASPDWTIPGIEATIAADPALVARLISVSNSALYGAAVEIRTLNQALVRLGYRAIRSLVIVAGARALFPLDDEHVGRWGRELWRHSAGAGVAARMVAEAARQRDPDDAFAAGVLHDIGKVVILLNRPGDYGRIQELVLGGCCDSRAAETAIAGVDHAHLAACLTSRWTLPAGIVGAIVGHHEPDRSGEHARLARIVACGNDLAHLHEGRDPEVLLPAVHDALGRLGLAFGAAEDLVERVRLQLADLGDLV
ncbi:MAG: HDOD domain-containing protein [Krumholzibacteria bacterium]|nr:HDOD domain-containing protein [Candidatus Krumholzibacteria bacterium]